MILNFQVTLLEPDVKARLELKLGMSEFLHDAVHLFFPYFDVIVGWVTNVTLTQ